MANIRVSASSIRQAMAKPRRKAPQLLQVPFRDRAEWLFKEECPCAPLIALELEVIPWQGDRAYQFSAYAGVRSVSGTTALHIMPYGNGKLSWEDVSIAVCCLAATVRVDWPRKQRLLHERQILARKLQQEREWSRRLSEGISPAR